MEAWNAERYRELGLDAEFVQSNLSKSIGTVLRGLHYQYHHPQGKLVSVVEGAILDVAVDIRPDSERFGQWVSRKLDDETRHQLYVPPGFAHGFCSLSEVVVVSYLCTTAYDAASDANVLWNDPDIGIDWPVSDPQLSARDNDAPQLKDIPRDQLPTG